MIRYRDGKVDRGLWISDQGVDTYKDSQARIAIRDAMRLADALADALDAALAREQALREALRKYTIEEWNGGLRFKRCLLCNMEWGGPLIEQHAPGCLCELPTSTKEEA